VEMGQLRGRESQILGANFCGIWYKPPLVVNRCRTWAINSVMFFFNCHVCLLECTLLNILARLDTIEQEKMLFLHLSNQTVGLLEFSPAKGQHFFRRNRWKWEVFLDSSKWPSWLCYTLLIAQNLGRIAVNVLLGMQWQVVLHANW